MRRHGATVVLLALLAGCATSGDVKPHRIEIGGAYSIDPQIKWSRFRQRTIEIWSIDGPALEALYFVKGVGNGEPLVVNAKEPKKWPVFSQRMTPNEIMELLVDTLANSGYAQLQAQELRPEKFGRLSGFRFELTFLFPDGLEGQGLAIGAIIKQRLQLIVYLGTREYYYSKHIGDVEKIIQSIEVKD